MDTTTFSALAEPNRLDIVELLRDGPLTVGEITERLELNQPQASKHLRVLHDAGLVEVNPVANRRIYRLRPEPLLELDSWLESFRRLWEERYDRLDEYLRELQAKEHDQDGNK
ncbi:MULTISPECIES: ArsR/SmtB family transcription factor [Paenibacillus]|jgi:DNA-binding transcriptional ArsR family regulator|uniref:Winged helix-turn-helix transcriptional regulator n=1 Tax=Paenibacillus oceani TaxID=2772510 RepID=A0A927CGR9_9BACL|nr:metalloregulator ArsR/SmtB family transcription factor [Paenibacillus oceani]MBD2865926.1 winged helix-turn-helix transcriptional regulator [Paenibacillus oceani]MDF2660077.1 TrmB family transcriptional regulator [Paenibacillus sp.]